ncbi:MAG: cyclophilin-like fold protein [Candidatus Omnitrophica bacterium]|nr:cyclophilin-like fold protein [Candidatus Omnitrophota bacterium]MDD5488256.1 cyclophilin-like fold protein [Candidatus Omnitrophota bacterium]
MRQISLISKKTRITIELSDIAASLSLYHMLPVSSQASLWGKEIYFPIPRISVSGAVLTEQVEIGDVGFWPEGNCFCVFFGRTPMSTSERPVPASGVVLLGRVDDGLASLSDIPAGAGVELHAVNV